ncbi:MAG: OmpH family outer membrane protein [Gallionellaceae bacterium]|nr:OmpH family outer membrane protein [Gallionellaceae bacterium]
MKNQKLKTWLIGFMPILLALYFTQVAAADFRIGVVDTERILRESVLALKAEKKIEKEFAARDQEIKRVSQQIKDIHAFLDKEGMTLPDAERRNKERELDNLNVNLQRLQREFREDLNLRKNEELVVVLGQANKAIQQIAESEKYDLILQEAVYRNPKIDITEKVLKFLANEK